MNTHMAIIPQSEYEELKKIKVEREALKAEIQEELKAWAKDNIRSTYYTADNSKTLKGLGVFGVALLFIALIAGTGFWMYTLYTGHQEWYWYIPPVILAIFEVLASLAPMESVLG